MRLIDFETLNLQIKAKQPAWIFLVLIYALMQFGLNWFFTFIVYLKEGAIPNNAYYLCAWIVFQTIIVFFIVYYSSYQYRGALFSGIKKKHIWKIIIVGIMYGLPWIFFYFFDIKNLFLFCEQHHSLSQAKAISELHAKIWSPLGFGTTTAGIITASITAFIVPIYEECIFSGLLFNKLANKLRLPFAVLLCSFLFAMIHFWKTGFGMDLFLIFLVAISSILARLTSGCWISSLVTHWVFNLIIFTPKWMIALLAIK